MIISPNLSFSISRFFFISLPWLVHSLDCGSPIQHAVRSIPNENNHDPSKIMTAFLGGWSSKIRIITEYCPDLMAKFSKEALST